MSIDNIRSELKNLIEKSDPNHLRFDTNLCLTTNYFKVYIQAFLENLPNFDFMQNSVIVTNIQQIVETNKIVKYSFINHCASGLVASLANNNSLAQSYHKLLYSVSNKYRMLEYNINSITKYKEKYVSKNKSNYLTEIIKIYLTNFKISNLLCQIVVLQIEHYYTLVFYRESLQTQIYVYISDSTLENAYMLYESLECIDDKDINVVVPPYNRQRGGHVCSIFSLLDVQIICKHVANNTFINLIKSETFAPEMMVGCECVESFERYCRITNVLEYILDQYKKNLNSEGKNIYCYNILKTLV
jgi:hypothetical protein